MKTSKGKKTSLCVGDLICVDVGSRNISITRDGFPLYFGGDNKHAGFQCTSQVEVLRFMSVFAEVAGFTFQYNHGQKKENLYFFNVLTVDTHHPLLSSETRFTYNTASRELSVRFKSGGAHLWQCQDSSLVCDIRFFAGEGHFFEFQQLVAHVSKKTFTHIYRSGVQLSFEVK